MHTMWSYLTDTTILKRVALWQDYFFFLIGKLKGESFKDHKTYVQELNRDTFTDKETPLDRAVALQSFTIAIVVLLTIMDILIIIPSVLLLSETTFFDSLTACMAAAVMTLSVLFGYFTLRSYPAYLYARKINKKYPGDDHQIRAKSHHVFYNVEFLILCPIIIGVTSAITYNFVLS
jgi:hypothetical protein